jgi:hypothetical protein
MRQVTAPCCCNRHGLALGCYSLLLVDKYTISTQYSEAGLALGCYSLLLVDKYTISTQYSEATRRLPFFLSLDSFTLPPHAPATHAPATSFVPTPPPYTHTPASLTLRDSGLVQFRWESPRAFNVFLMM